MDCNRDHDRRGLYFHRVLILVSGLGGEKGMDKVRKLRNGKLTIESTKSGL